MFRKKSQTSKVPPLSELRALLLEDQSLVLSVFASLQLPLISPQHLSRLIYSVTSGFDSSSYEALVLRLLRLRLKQFHKLQKPIQDVFRDNSALAHLLILFIREFGNDYLKELLVPCIVKLKEKYPTESNEESVLLEMTEYFIQEVMDALSESMNVFPMPISRLFSTIRLLLSENVHSESPGQIQTSFSDPDFYKRVKRNDMPPKVQSANIIQDPSVNAHVVDSIIASLFFLRIMGPSNGMESLTVLALACPVEYKITDAGLSFMYQKTLLNASKIFNIMVISLHRDRSLIPKNDVFYSIARKHDKLLFNIFNVIMTRSESREGYFCLYPSPTAMNDFLEFLSIMKSCHGEVEKQMKTILLDYEHKEKLAIAEIYQMFKKIM